MNMPIITVTKTSTDKYYVNGGTPGFSLSRRLTGTCCEDGRGIFSMDYRMVEFDCISALGYTRSKTFPLRPEITSSMTEAEIAAEITERVRIVREWVDSCQHPKQATTQPASSDPQLSSIASCIDRLQSLADEMDKQIKNIRKITGNKEVL